MSAYDHATPTLLTSQFGDVFEVYTATTAGPVYTVKFRARPPVLVRVGVLNNLTATVAPTADDDSGDGYAVLSAWADTTGNKWYHCTDPTLTAAVWVENAAVSVVAVTSPRPVALTEQADGRLDAWWRDDPGTGVVQYKSLDRGATWAVGP